MGRVSSSDFTYYLAYKRRNTWSYDVWFSALQVALAQVTGTLPERFVPIAPDPKAEQARHDRDTAAAEADMEQRANGSTRG
jgi:hypothetical protein